MESPALVTISALLTAVILFQLSLLSRASKPFVWSLSSSRYRVGNLSTLAAAWLKLFGYVDVIAPLYQSSISDKRESKIKETKALAEHHEVAELLSEMIQKDGAGSWPPLANHTHSTWPAPLQPYKEIYLELAPLLPQATPSLDDEVNTLRIESFRRRFRDSLRDRVDLVEVGKLVQATNAGCWVNFSRDTWATIPIVKVAQREREVDLPIELVEPWISMQRHFGCASDAGNNTSNVVLNFDRKGTYINIINMGMAPQVTSREETFFRIFDDLEVFGVPVYYDMAQSIITFARCDNAACAIHVASIASQMRLVLGIYMDNLHDKMIAHSVWLSKIQGFQAWGIGHYDAKKDKWETFDGLSGNQVLLYQVLDAFLGIEQYLAPRDMERNLPMKQRELCYALRKHSFRRSLSEKDRQDRNVAELMRSFEEILKRLRLFRAAHRTRSRAYLSQAAPERMPMTAGKSLLDPSLDASLAFLDGFMARQLAQTT
ncbi:hypothetical protein G6011_08361 [Alternaria panax]|uniref:Indoleamine 2,3-dioxygenase n=1 Tax=Alternaria panax TaxID=48097 RepID=A0AAD4I8K4_9PLEO|nr:hypothetical protein G6011_08361 [Alternaria panax]